MLLLPFLSHAQLPTNEGFESATFPPTAPGNWITMDNGVGTAVSWAETTDPLRVYAGLKAAIIDRENVGTGNTSIDWLVTPQITVGANSQLRFFTRQTLVGNNGSTYEIRVSTNASQTLQSAYTTVQSWTETTLNATYNIYEEKTVSLAAYPAGTQLYIAFVKLNTQPTTATTGDRWLVDDVKVVQQCLDPTVLNIGLTLPTSQVLTWTANGTPLSYDVEVIPFANTFTNIPTQVGFLNNTAYTGLTPGTAYKYQVRANCGLGNYSAWVGPFNFLTTPYGSICSSPLTITSLPFSQTSNTNLYGDEVDVIQGVGLCGAVPATTNYQAGFEVFYSYTPTVSGNITITMNPTGASSSLFVYNGCGTYPGTCIAGVANTAATPRTIVPLAVVAGQTYIIVISSSTTPVAGIPYTLIVQNFNCAAPVGQPITGITTTGANLSWTNPTAATAWEVAIQPAGAGIPTGAGVSANTNINWPTPTLTIATSYQYWVRSDCGGGLFSAWAGAYLFNTETCNATEKCNYTFRLTDTLGDGWEGGTMEVRQNGVVVAILGPTMTTTGPTGSLVNVIVPVCQTLPLELYWTNGGASPTEIGISIINNAPFNQTIFTKPAGTGNPSTTTPLYTTTFNCSQPACLPPTALTVTAITTAGATIGWTGSVGITAWDIYVVPTGSPAPTATTLPTFANITTRPFIITTLLPNTTYQYYIRTICSATSSSVWTVATATIGNFTTLPTCSRPTLPTVTGVTPFTAILNWTQPVNPPPGGGFASTWDIFVLPCGSPAPTATSIPTATAVTKPYTFSGLVPVTCYNFYVRARCTATDISPTTTVVVFNTPDINDECINAKLVPVNQNTNCLQTVFGTVAGATASPQANTCGATADDDDVWFQFTATATTHYISLLTTSTVISGQTVFPAYTFANHPTGLNYALYKGTNCGALTQISCRTNNGNIETGLVVGETYKIRVYSPGTSVSTRRFEICVGTKINNCPTAIPVCAIGSVTLRNDVGVPSIPNPINGSTSAAVGIVLQAPAPSFYYITIPTNGNYVFDIRQSTDPTFAFTDLDVDFVSWGPFPNVTAACAGISVSTTRPSPFGSSYSGAPIETFTLNSAIAGQVYVLMVTNFTAFNNPPGYRGYTKISKTSGPAINTVDCCPFVNFSYSSNFYCKGASNPVPTILTGSTLGTYSCTNSGLIINTTTGVIDILASVSGTYTVKSEILGANGCNTSNSFWTLTISDPANATISYSAQSFCNTITSSQPVTQTGTLGGYYYATPAGLSINTTTGAIIPSTSLPGFYTVKYNVFVSGCTSVPFETTVAISSLPIATLVSSDADNTICSNETATITVTPTNFIATAATYAWTLNGNPIAETTNVISPIATGTYGVTISLNGCTNASPLTMLFTVNALPTYTLTGTNIIKCVNENAVLTVNPTNYTLGATGITYSWTLDGVPVTTANTTNTISSTQYGVYEVSVGNSGCITKRTITVGLDTANIPINTVGTCEGPNYIITASPVSGSFLPTAGDVIYEWTNDSGTVVGTNQNSFNVTQYVANGGFSIFPQTFTVKITTIPDGCTDNQEFIVESLVCTIQKGISPNGDGKNDFLDLRGLGVKQLTIFNRYGSKIFSQENYTNEWRGQNSKSENSPVGTYYYVIELKTGENKTGWIYINR